MASFVVTCLTSINDVMLHFEELLCSLALVTQASNALPSKETSIIIATINSPLFPKWSVHSTLASVDFCANNLSGVFC